MATEAGVPDADSESRHFWLFREVGVSNGSLNERLVPADSQSRRDCVLQPRVARNELPWEIVQTASQPQRGCGRARHPRTHLQRRAFELFGHRAKVRVQGLPNGLIA